MIWEFIPPPPFRDAFNIGPIPLHMYSLTMVTGIIVAFVWSTRRAVKAGADRDSFETMGLIAVLCGVIGARIYHVATEHTRYFGPGTDPLEVFRIWHGGIGVIGAISGGALGVWALCRWKGINTAHMFDQIAPTLFIAQAIGRIGNYFNQEAFGQPTTLPWALEVEPAFRPPGYGAFETFHPTFIYEGVWNIIGCFVLLWVVRRFKWQNGKVMAGYVLWYTFGRFFIEIIRIDPVSHVAGIRVNLWIDGLIFVIAVGAMIFLMRRFPGYVEKPLADMGEKWRGKAAEKDAEESVAEEIEAEEAEAETEADAEEAEPAEKDADEADEAKAEEAEAEADEKDADKAEAEADADEADADEADAD